MIILTILKKLGKGVFYVLTPFIMIVASTCVGIYGVFAFITLLCKSIYYFFTGRKFTNILPEDVEAKERLSNMIRPMYPNPMPQQPQPLPQQQNIYQNYVPQNNNANINNQGFNRDFNQNNEFSNLNNNQIQPQENTIENQQNQYEKYDPYSSNNDWENKQ